MIINAGLAVAIAFLLELGYCGIVKIKVKLKYQK